MWGILIAVISGMLMSIQGVFNTGVTKQSGLWITSAFVSVTAFLVCIIMWFIEGRQGSISQLFQVEDRYMLLGGVIGAFITITVVKSMAALEPAKAVMIIVISQVITAYVIELLGIFNTDKSDFEIRKLIGVVISLAGLVIFMIKK